LRKPVIPPMYEKFATFTVSDPDVIFTLLMLAY